MTQPCDSPFSAWNPGIESEIPAALREQETIFRSDNVSTSYSDVTELAAQFGLKLEDLIVFKPARLALHEMIVRVSATLSIPEGETEADLGLAFRKITLHILNTYAEGKMLELEQGYATLSAEIAQQVAEILAKSIFASQNKPAAKNTSWLSRLFKPRKPAPAINLESKQERDYRIISEFKDKSKLADSAQQRQIYRSLHKVLGTISSHCGQLASDQPLLTRLCSNHALNAFASRWIGRQLDPLFQQAIAQEGYQIAPNDPDSVLVSLKGASAAGKSSSRPALKEKYFSSRDKDYITISPDIWRRLLLDYDSLGNAYKYAGRFTSLEVNVIDDKLDRFILSRAERDKAIPNIMVDRFRFDSFTTDIVTHLLRNTYAKYLSTLHMVFVITPPEETVVRGWERGLRNGRYKSAEDFLGHSVEAYTGMPNLFLRWLKAQQPDFRYRFVDNSVAKGQPPLLIAHGDKNEINILRPAGFINVVRFQKINVQAKNPQAVYPPDEQLAVARNTKFLEETIRAIPTVNFLSKDSEKPFAFCKNSRLTITDTATFKDAVKDEETLAIFVALFPTETKAAIDP